MTDNVVDIGCVTTLDIDPNKVLKGAEDQLESGIVVGWDRDGELYFASSIGNERDVLWMLEMAKARLLEGE